MICKPAKSFSLGAFYVCFEVVPSLSCFPVLIWLSHQCSENKHCMFTFKVCLQNTIIVRDT